MLDIVIGICTCRRPEGLLNLLQHIAELEYDGTCSVVVVDNDKKNKAPVSVMRWLTIAGQLLAFSRSKQALPTPETELLKSPWN